MYYWRGQAKCQIGRYADAIADFDEVIRTDPNTTTTNLPYAYYWRGLAKKNLGDRHEAKQDFQTALQLATETNNTLFITKIEEELSQL